MFLAMKRFLFSTLLLLAIVVGARAQEHIVADGTATNEFVPIYGLYADCYLRSQVIYPAEMIAGAEISSGNVIAGLEYYYSNAPTNLSSIFTVLIGEVDYTTFSSSSFADNSGFTTVYQGTLARVDDKLPIEFSTPYTYQGGNLIIEIRSESIENYEPTNYYGIESSGSSLQGYAYSNADDVSPTQRDFIPKTNFILQESCPGPRDLAFSNTTFTSVDFSWTAGGEETSWVVKYGPEGFDVTDASVAEYPVSTNSYSISNLTAFTYYDVYP